MLIVTVSVKTQMLKVLHWTLPPTMLQL